jgi:hypothetical protein
MDAARAALQQRETEALFQFADLLAERRLCDMNRGRGARKAARFDDLHEISQMTKLHGGGARRSARQILLAIIGARPGDGQPLIRHHTLWRQFRTPVDAGKSPENFQEKCRFFSAIRV